MRLQYGIAFNLAVIACLASILLGMGSSTYFSTFLVFLGAVASLYLTDILQKVRLNRFVSNTLILLVVFGSVGSLIRNYHSEDLAIGIARLLQLVQIVVLFQEKNSRNRWHILLISFLQVAVATAFQQSLIFGLLLFVYVFANLCALTLIFLHDENAYFKSHSFSRNIFQLNSAELREKQNLRRLLKIAFATTVIGPLSLILLYRETDSDEPGNPRLPKMLPYDAKQQASLKQKIAKKSGEAVDSDDYSSRVSWQPVSQSNSGAIDLWEDLAEDGVDEPGENSVATKLLDVFNSVDKSGQTYDASPKWPLMFANPVFSGGTNRQTGLVGGRRELYFRLINAAFWSLIFGVAIFIFTPRLGEVSIFGHRFSYQRWTSGQSQPISSVGFTDEIRLGSLGSVMQNYQEVLSVNFETRGLKESDSQAMFDRSSLLPYKSYAAISGQEFYLRGVVVDRYDSGRWSRSELRGGSPPMLNALVPVRVPDENRFGRKYENSRSSELFFDKNSDLIRATIITQPLNTQVLFAIWPFTIDTGTLSRIRVLSDRIEMTSDSRNRRRPFGQIYHTTVFKNGVQEALTPCQEDFSPIGLVQYPKDQLPGLIALAKEWNDRSRLNESDWIARSKNLEKRLKEDTRFTYQLGFIQRDYDLDPLEDFVSKTPRGHCEYFAGTLAMMLRSQGIPARICIGYKAVAETPSERGYIVRQSDAHSWVEAYIPPQYLPSSLTESKFARYWEYGGWLRLDPTPDQDTSLMKGFSMSLTDLSRFVQNFWRQNVLSMDGSRQSELVYRPIWGAFTKIKDRFFHVSLWKETGIAILERYKMIFDQIASGTFRASDFVLIAIPFLIVFALLFLLHKIGILRLLRRLFIGVDITERRRQASIEFYVRMEKLLASVSINRKPSETQREFASRAVQILFERLWKSDASAEGAEKPSFEHLDRSAEQIVDSFYRVRFGNEDIKKEELDRIENDLHLLKIATEKM